MDAEHDDATLAMRIAAGDDREAEAALCRRWLPRVRVYGRLHLRDADSASDLAQETLAVVIHALREKRVNETERLGAYVSGVCRNLARDWTKTERRKNALLERFGPTWADVAAPPARIEQSRLVDCLKKLGARDRAVVVLTYYAGSDGEEIATDLGMSLGNVRITRHRALKQLLLCVGGEP
jgi:RNA polymerase sigma-70 factor (ECF subfamily)